MDQSSVVLASFHQWVSGNVISFVTNIDGITGGNLGCVVSDVSIVLGNFISVTTNINGITGNLDTVVTDVSIVDCNCISIVYNFDLFDKSRIAYFVFLQLHSVSYVYYAVLPFYDAKCLCSRG